MRGNRRLSVLLLAVSFLATIALDFQFSRFAKATTSVVELPPMSLTIVGANGTQVVLNESDIAGLSSYRGYGGYKKQTGSLTGLGNYTGVPLNTLCNLVGGLTNTSTVKVIAVDTYSKNFTFAEVNGEFITYDNVTGAEIAHSQPLVPIVAYYFNDADIGSSDGPLKLAIIGPEGLATNSSYWVKWVVRVEVVDQVVPEFPSLMVLSLLFLVTLTAALSMKLRHQRKNRLDQSGRLTE